MARLILRIGTHKTGSSAIQTALREEARKLRRENIYSLPLFKGARMMKTIGYGKGYEYDHDTAEGFSGQNYFPEGMARREFYQPVERGFERDLRKRLDYWARLRERRGEE